MYLLYIINRTKSLNSFILGQYSCSIIFNTNVVSMLYLVKESIKLEYLICCFIFTVMHNAMSNIILIFVSSVLSFIIIKEKIEVFKDEKNVIL